MHFQIKIQTLFVTKPVLLYVLLFLFSSCNISSNKCLQCTHQKHSLTITINSTIIEDNIEKVSSSSVTFVAEQDPNGILWGLRDVVNGKLVLDYSFQMIFEFKQGYAVVILNGKYGLIDKKGKVIVEPIYGYSQGEINCGYIAFAYGDGSSVFFDTTSKTVLPVLAGAADALLCQKRKIVSSYQRKGMLNFDGDIILPFKFIEAYLLPEGLCIASIAEKDGNTPLYGLYDLNGKQLLPHVYEFIDRFYCGRARVKKDGKYGAIDERGKELFYTEYSRFDRYKNNYAVVYRSQKNGEINVGMIDKNGREVVPVSYQWLDNLYNFSEGMAAMAQNGKYGFVDTTGRIRIPFKYDKVESFDNGIARVMFGGRAGYINANGEAVIPIDFTEFYTNQFPNLRRYYNEFIIGLKDSAWQVYNYAGKKITSMPYEQIGEFNEKEKSLLVSRNGKSGVLDSNFRVRIPLEYGLLETIFPNTIAFRKNGTSGFINNSGKIIANVQFDYIGPYGNNNYQFGFAAIELNGKKGLINSYCKLVIPPKYEEVGDFSYGLSVVKRNNKYGFVNSKGKEVIPAVYDEAASFDGYSAKVTLKGETFEIDFSGKRIEDDY